MTARLSIEVTSPEALSVPVSATKVDQGRAWVYVIDNGKARKVEVGLGVSDGRTVQVVRGLSADQMVAVSNVSLLTDGAAVKVTP